MASETSSGSHRQISNSLHYHLDTGRGARRGSLDRHMEWARSWKNGKLTQYEELEGLHIFAVIKDDEGSIWAGTSGPNPRARMAIRKSATKVATHCIPRVTVKDAVSEPFGASESL